MGELIAIASGKGGTGKTSICAGIATALAEMGEKVLCIDCDVGLRNLDISLGLGQEGAVSFLDVMAGRYSLSDALQHPAYENLRFLTAPMNCAADAIDGVAFAGLLQRSREQFSYVLLDAPAGVDAGFRLAAGNADRVLLVCGADPASIRDASLTAHVLARMGKASVRLIVNRVNKKIAASLGKTVDDIMDFAGLPLMGVVPEDAQVTLSAAFGKPLLQGNKRLSAAACRRIAKRIKGYNVPIDI
jgi:septum site-determining protein MinD